MTANLVEVYNGSTQEQYSGGQIILTRDYLSDEATVTIKPDTAIASHSLITFKASGPSGTPTFWAGRVENINRSSTWDLKIYGLGYELNRVKVQNVWTNASPEQIVNDVITNYTTGLTYSTSSGTSGYTIGTYIADAYAIDVLADMMQILGWGIRIDYNGYVYFESDTSNPTGITYTNGTDCTVTDWSESKTLMVNKVRVEGGFENYATQETVTGTGTTFSLTNQPNGTVRVTVSSTEQNPSTYTVDASNKQIVFNSSVTDPTFFYSYNRPVIVENQDDVSVNAYGTYYQKYPAPWLTATEDARQYAQKILNAYSDPLATVNLTLKGFHYDRKPGDVVSVVDSFRNKSGTFVVSQVKHDLSSQQTSLELGERTPQFDDVQRAIEDRIKTLEARFTNENQLYIVRLTKQKITASVAVVDTWQQNSPVDSFVVGHHTLGRIRSGFDYEPDCGPVGNHAVWTGTGVTTGAQYSTSGYRLSCAEGNGTDRILTASAVPFSSAPSKASVSFWFKIPSSSFFSSDQILVKSALGHGYSVRVWYDHAADTLRAEYVLDGASWGLYYSSFSGIVQTGTWYACVVNLDASSGGSLYLRSTLLLQTSGDPAYNVQDNNTGTSYDIGTTVPTILSDGTTYTDAVIDEFLVLSNTLSGSDLTDMFSKHLYDTTHAQYSNAKIYYSFDNPKTGDRSTAKTTI